MNVTINYYNKPSVIKYCPDYATAKQMRFNDNSISSITDRFGKRI